MKKSLLFAALMMGAMSVNAQTEICFSDPASAGLASEKAAFDGGTVVGESENVTMKLAYDDTWGSTSIDFQGYKGAIVNGTEATFTTGVVGNSNPSATVYSQPTSGAVIQFDVKKDGYLTVFGKLSSNKPYYVWEGDAIFANPMAYTLAMDWSAGKNAGASIETIIYTIPADDLGYIDMTAADIDRYVASNDAILWPERIALNDLESNIAQNGVGAIIFPVFAEAGSYLVHATGSKISTCGAIFTEEPVTELILTGPDVADLTLIGNGAGISDVVAAGVNKANAPIYNLAGQRVSKDAKGILIQNGQKFINK